jgi:acyl-CoA thioesterase-1
MKNKHFLQLVGIGSHVLFSFSFYLSQRCTFKSVRPMNIVCLGDSITSGFKLPAPETSSFPSQLEKMSGNKWKITNAGVTGGTALKKGDISIWTTDVFSSIKKTEPDVVVLMLGTNDTKDINWPHISFFEADYSEIVQQIKELPGHPEVILCSVPPIEGFNHLGISDGRATELTGQVREIAEATETHYVDFTSPLAGKPKLFLDGLHPNEQGAQIIAKILMKSIIQMQKALCLPLGKKELC